MKKRIVFIVAGILLVSCGPKRLGCGPRRCDVDSKKIEYKPDIQIQKATKTA
ncbi:hypothetical protein [Flavobacterium supellecticarium]|uniref:hypothetical protein n=1 Tax=Flavobacterium supellecticarium TaxID=2565924 RepID=UPI001454C9F3|nr:hypothetical protein [Flavobacterium supellecticarium]